MVHTEKDDTINWDLMTKNANMWHEKELFMFEQSAKRFLHGK